MEIIEGHVERITFHNPDNQYTVARLRVGGTGNLITIVGTLPEPAVGETLRVEGIWKDHPRFGQQLQIASVEVLLPDSAEGIRTYLSSGMIPGIGPKMAARLVEHFGAETLDVIENRFEELTEVAGIGQAKAEVIRTAWQDHHSARRLMSFLREIEVKPSFGPKLLKLYGPDAVEMIQEDPFRLIEDLPRFGFYIADAIFRYQDLPIDSDERARACVLHLLQEDADSGHTYSFDDELTDRCRRLFDIDEGTVEYAVNHLVDGGEIVVEEPDFPAEQPVVYLKALQKAEKGIAQRLGALLAVPPPDPAFDSARASEKVFHHLAISLSDEQLAVLEGIFSHRVVIVTGGPGTGKTTLIRSICAVLESEGKRVLLAAPTGRAARRLAAVTRHEAATIHRLLGYLPTENRFSKNGDSPLDADGVIVDEASMIDTLLMDHLLRAVPASAMLILVGDAFQLPSVGAGTVLDDMIRSDRIPVFWLTRIFRQAEESLIVQNAHRIRQGGSPEIPSPSSEDGDSGSEFYFMEAANSERTADLVIELCAKSIPDRFGLDPVKDIQVLTPMHKGKAGTIHLNRRLQDALNPNPPLIEKDGLALKLNDKVMHLKNNYTKEVFNGDIGTVSDVDRRNRILVVDYEDRPVEYEFTEIDELTLAYAISIHKSQGSEYAAVVIPLVTQHFALLQRNLLYTAVTRARQLVVLVGSQRALQLALEKDSPMHRKTGLVRRFHEIFPAGI